MAANGTLSGLRLRGRPDFRKTFVFSLLALIALVVGIEVGGVGAPSVHLRLAGYGCAVLTGVFGFAASQTAAREVQRIAVARAGDVAGTPLRLVTLLVGYTIGGSAVCWLVGIDLRQLLVGGAITGIIVGLAAQPVLSNLFAGLVLLFARPYLPGQQVRVLSGSINGPLEGVVTSAGLLYTVLQTAEGPLNIPNSALLTAAVGPALKKAEEDERVDPAAEPPALAPGGQAGTLVGATQQHEAARNDSAEGSTK